MRVAILGWGVKQSLRSYVEMNGGTFTADDGATRAPDGAFAFEAVPESDLAVDGGTPSGTGRFRGRIGLQAHGGMLSITLTDPWIEPDASGLVLSIAESLTRRTAIARLDLAAAVEEPDGGLVIPTATTLDGMMILGDHYPPGTALDPVRLGAT